MLAHEETIQELELTVNELPIVIQTKIKKLNNRKRMSVKAEKLAEIQKDIERDKILTAEDAQKYGIIDQVIASSKAPQK